MSVSFCLLVADLLAVESRHLTVVGDRPIFDALAQRPRKGHSRATSRSRCRPLVGSFVRRCSTCSTTAHPHAPQVFGLTRG